MFKCVCGLVAGGLAIMSGAVVAPVVAGATGPVADGVVYHDVDHDGVHDPDEPGIPGLVVRSEHASTVTDTGGAWTLPVTARERITVQTGWYRTQCHDVTCTRGPGADQDFSVKYQSIVSRAGHGAATRLDVGLVPDWPGGYPMPPPGEHVANGPDVAVRTKFVKPTGRAGRSECYRTADARHRVCAPGDRARFVIEIHNEGSTPIVDPAGHVELPPGTAFVLLGESAWPPNHPDLAGLTVGPFDPATRRVVFAIDGILPRGAIGIYDLVIEVTGDAAPTPVDELQVRGEYPNPVGARITSVWRDAESVRCTDAELDCPWGMLDRQTEPDNSDAVGFAVGGALPGDAGPKPPGPTPPGPTPPGPGGEPDCAVSELLVPSCGVWLGASTPSRDGRYDYDRGLAEYELVARNTPDILHFYKRGAQRFPTDAEQAQAARPGRQPSLLLYNWKPSMSDTWAEIAAGAADAEIEVVAASISNYSHRLFLNIFHEPEDNVRPAAGSGMTPADYVAMYRHVVDRFRELGVDNVVYVWNPMGYHGWQPLLDELYPGDDHVDWIGYDPYAKGNRQGTLADIVNTPNDAADWPGFYEWATAKAPGKPLMLSEWGVDLLSNDDPASVLGGDAAALLEPFPQVKALVYWNDVDRVNARIDMPTERGRALGAAYRRFAAQPVFNAMSPAAAF